MQSLTATCPRDKVETNISCARCGEPICPQCMVYTAVGNKCRDCASIGGPEMFKVERSDLVKGAALGTIAAVAIGALFGAMVWSLGIAPIIREMPPAVGYVAVIMLNAAGAFASGMMLRPIVGVKYSNSLRVLAATLGLVYYVAETATAIALGLPYGVLITPSLIGFAIGAYYAMNRYKAH